jgi:hypothetical protein
MALQVDERRPLVRRRDILQLCLAGGDTRGSRRMIITELNLLVVEDAWKNWMLGVSTAPVGLCADVVGAS